MAAKTVTVFPHLAPFRFGSETESMLAFRFSKAGLDFHNLTPLARTYALDLQVLRFGMEEAAQAALQRGGNILLRRHETDISNRQQFIRNLNAFTEEEIGILDGPSPPYSIEEINADAVYDGFHCPLSRSIPSENNMVWWLGQIYDLQFVEAYRLTNPRIYRNPLTNEVISEADFLGGETPLTFQEKLNIQGVTFAYHRRSVRREAKNRYDVLCARYNQRISLQANQIETRALVQNMGGSTVASPPRAMVDRLIRQDDVNLQVLGAEYRRGAASRRVSDANVLPNVNLDASDDEAPTINPMDNMPVLLTPFPNNLWGNPTIEAATSQFYLNCGVVGLSSDASTQSHGFFGF
jgi:hypothetical protein